MPAAVHYREALEKSSKGAVPGDIGHEAFVSTSVLDTLAAGYTPESIEASLKRYPEGAPINRIPMVYDSASRTLRGFVDIAVASQSG